MSNKVNAEQNLYKNLQERYKEMNEFLLSLIEDNKQAGEELRYLHEFISYKELDEEFYYFKKNAHEEFDEDMPFSRLTL